MKLTFTLIIFLSAIISAYSQDLVVDIHNDSISCKINKLTKNQIWYYTKNKQFVKRVSSIRSYIKGYYNTSNDSIHVETKLPKQNTQYKEKVNENNIPINDNIEQAKNFSISIYGGFSFLTAKANNDQERYLNDYFEKLKNGYNIGGDVYYYNDKGWGIGVFLDRFHTSNSRENVSFTDTVTGIVRKGSLKTKITHTSVGIVLTKRFKINNYIYLEPYVSISYMEYFDDAVIYEPIIIESWCIAESIGGRIDVKIADNTYLNIRTSYFMGMSDSYTYSNSYGKTVKKDLPDKEYVSFNKINLSFGLGFVF